MSEPHPSQAQLESALKALDPYASHPDTGAIHDPLYLMLRDPQGGHLDDARQALLRHRDHPAAPQLRDTLGPAFAVPERTLVQVLDAHGPWKQDDPLEEVHLRLAEAARVRSVLEDKLAGQLRELDGHARTSNALAMIGALLAVFALVGWLGALGLWQIDWFAPPEPPSDVVGPEPRP